MSGLISQTGAGQSGRQVLDLNRRALQDRLQSLLGGTGEQTGIPSGNTGDRVRTDRRLQDPNVGGSQQNPFLALLASLSGNQGGDYSAQWGKARAEDDLRENRSRAAQFLRQSMDIEDHGLGDSGGRSERRKRSQIAALNTGMANAQDVIINNPMDRTGTGGPTVKSASHGMLRDKLQSDPSMGNPPFSGDVEYMLSQYPFLSMRQRMGANNPSR